MPKYTFISESTPEEDGYYEKRSYEFHTDGGIDQLVFHSKLFYNLDGYPYAEKLIVVKEGGGTVDSDGFS